MGTCVVSNWDRDTWRMIVHSFINYNFTWLFVRKQVQEMLPEHIAHGPNLLCWRIKLKGDLSCLLVASPSTNQPCFSHLSHKYDFYQSFKTYIFSLFGFGSLSLRVLSLVLVLWVFLLIHNSILNYLSPQSHRIVSDENAFDEHLPRLLSTIHPLENYFKNLWLKI